MCKACGERPRATLGALVLPMCEPCLVMDDEQEAEYERQEAEQAERAELERREHLLNIAGGSPRMMAWTLDTYPADTDEARAALAAGREWGKGAVEWWRRTSGWGFEPYRNLVLVGDVGVGKSGLAWGVVRRCCELGTPAMFAPWAQVLAESRDAMRTREASPRLARCAKVPVLALDDLGAERPTDYARDELLRIVNARYDRGLPTIATSNYNVGELGERLGRDDVTVGHRIVSRLLDGAQAVKWTATPDRRLS